LSFLKLFEKDFFHTILDAPIPSLLKNPGNHVVDADNFSIWNSFVPRSKVYKASLNTHAGYAKFMDFLEDSIPRVRNSSKPDPTVR